MNENEDSRIGIAKRIHLGILAGPSIFLTLCLTILKDRAVHENDNMAMIALVFSIGVIFLSFLIPKKFAHSVTASKAAFPNKPFSQFGKYQTYKIIQWYLLEVGALFNIVVFFLTKNSNSIYAGIALLVFIASRFPSIEEMNRIIPKEPDHNTKDADFL